MENVVCNHFVDFTLPNKVKNKNYKISRVLKDDNRSEVKLIQIDKKKYVYKIPKEKNKRVWQRFISIFRGSESKREYENYLKILNLGFKGPVPIMYWEKKVLGMSFDSFLIMTYIEGKSATLEELNLVKKELERIHRKGYLHGDSQLSNFMVSKKKIFLIDAKLVKNIYRKIGEAYEFIYLEESCHVEVDVYNKKIISYKLAKSLNSYLHWFGKIKKTIRRKER
ncbi:MAG: lipopolysaccharide core heptose(II) kinase RfaY [Cetobacterium sp.]|uniref:lipopolysaccharide core heptose(II) kinase RfaY n=1 Tax=Cetobacterium sp. TaxID=2071632 RepID=UPI003F308A54